MEIKSAFYPSFQPSQSHPQKWYEDSKQNNSFEVSEVFLLIGTIHTFEIDLKEKKPKTPKAW